MLNKPVVIFDIDGTLADDSHRSKLFDFDNMTSEDWEKYFSFIMYYDTPIQPTIEIMNMFLTLNYDVYCLTGRPDTRRELTLDWLCENVRDYAKFDDSQLIMRPVDDYKIQSVSEWKFGIAKRLGLEQIFCVFEDANSCVKMWRENGIQCYQTQIGNF